jgi:hypothetical protein
MTSIFACALFRVYPRSSAANSSRVALSTARVVLTDASWHHSDHEVISRYRIVIDCRVYCLHCEHVGWLTTRR